MGLDINKLGTAQKAIILLGVGVPIPMLFKFTIMDLVSKGVLSMIETKEVLGHEGEKKEIRYMEFTKGEIFESYKASEFEKYFLTAFIKYPDLAITLHQWLPMICRAFQREENVKKIFLRSEPLPILFKKGWFSSSLESYRLTKEGKQCKISLEEEMSPFDPDRDQEKVIEEFLQLPSFQRTASLEKDVDIHKFLDRIDLFQNVMSENFDFDLTRVLPSEGNGFLWESGGGDGDGDGGADGGD